MTLILKSNVTAKKYFSDKTGLRDTDYLFNADFTQNFFRIGSTDAVFNDLINYKRVGVGYFYQDGQVKNVPEDTPILVGPDSKSGLWQQVRAGNKLGSGDMTTSKAAIFDKAADLGAEMSIQVWGEGSVKVSGDIEELPNPIVTNKNPTIFKTVSNAGKSNVSFTVEGGVSYYQVQSNNAKALLNPSPSTSALANIYLNKSVLRDEFVLLLRIAPYYNPKQSTIGPLFEIASNNNLLVGYLAINGSFLVTARNNVNAGATTQNLEYENDIVLALKFNKTNLAAYYKGEKVLETTSNQNSVISYVKLLGSDSFTPTNQFNGMLKNVACYTKSMTDNELKALSLSFG